MMRGSGRTCAPGVAESAFLFVVQIECRRKPVRLRFLLLQVVVVELGWRRVEESLGGVDEDLDG
jgi:hypothetical protein